MSEGPPFQVEPGDTILYVDKHGYQAGYFVTWDPKKGAAVIKKPAGGRVSMTTRSIRPANDGRMIKKRGWVEYRPAHLDEDPQPTTKRKK